MPSSLSTTDISNMALDYLDEAPLVSFNDDVGNVARWMRRNFWPVAWRLMRRHPWNFAIKRASLSATTAPAFGWTYAYPIPADCLRVLPLTCYGVENEDPIPYKVEGLNILTDQAVPVYVRYIARIDNTGLFDNGFAEVLAIALAQKAAHFITGKQSYAASLVQAAKEAMEEAQVLDSLEGTPDDPIDDFWILARQ